MTLALALMSLSFVLVARSTWAAVIGAVIAAAALSAVGYLVRLGWGAPDAFWRRRPRSVVGLLLTYPAYWLLTSGETWAVVVGCIFAPAAVWGLAVSVADLVRTPEQIRE